MARILKCQNNTNILVILQWKRTLIVSKGWPAATRHTPPTPPARKFFKAEELPLLSTFFSSAILLCYCQNASANMLILHEVIFPLLSRHQC